MRIGSHKYTINLSNSASINSALSDVIKDVTDKDALMERTEEYISKLCEMGASVAMANVPVYTGELKESITHYTEVKGNSVIGTVAAGTGHAAFVEFGTGVVGEGTYPADTQGYAYNVPTYDSEGRPIKDDTGGWWYVSDSGKRVYTHGHEATPFMYEAAKWMEQHAKEVL